MLLTVFHFLLIKGKVLRKFVLEKRRVSHILKLIDCLCVPDHSRILLTVSALDQWGAKVLFHDTCEIHCSD